MLDSTTARGNLLWKTDANGATATFTYDAIYRPTAASYPASEGQDAGGADPCHPGAKRKRILSNLPVWYFRVFFCPPSWRWLPDFIPECKHPWKQGPRNAVPVLEASENSLQSSYMQDAALLFPTPQSPALREGPSTTTGVHVRAWWTGSQRLITASRPPCFRASPTAPSANRRP